MIQFLKYNFLSDTNALDPFPVNEQTNLNTIQAQSAIFDVIYLTANTNSFDLTLPDSWKNDTIFYARFNNDLAAGSITTSTTSVNEIDSIKIKRRKVGEIAWLTINEIQVDNKASNLFFSGEDNFAESNQEYEYAWVPVNNGIEGTYTIFKVLSEFNGVFICDDEIIYKFFAGVEYGPSQQNQQVGIYNPLGKEYPIYVYNGNSNYQTGSVTGKLVGNYEDTGVFNRKEIVEQKNNMLQWLTNKKAKILKDWNGNIWLISVLNGASVSYDNQWGMGMIDINFQYGEVGSPYSNEDMQNVGLVPKTV